MTLFHNADIYTRLIFNSDF